MNTKPLIALFLVGCYDSVTPYLEDGGAPTLNLLETPCNNPINSTSCRVGVGGCQRTGITYCRDGITACTAKPGTPGIEVCGNTIDEDCDGAIDEGLGLGEPCVEGFGTCAQEGKWICVDHEVACDATPLPPTKDTICDGIDEDCDGLVDEGPPCNGINLTLYEGFEDGEMPQGWVGVPSGTHIRGANKKDEVDMNVYESPQHWVYLSKPFLIQQTEVSQEQFQAVMDYNPSLTLGQNRPVERVSWWEAVAFANTLSEHEDLIPCYTLNSCNPLETLRHACRDGDYDCTGWFQCDSIDVNQVCNGYRLPTDAEWEAATRAGTTERYWFGSDPKKVKTYEHCQTGLNEASKVGMKDANPYGLHDSLGNVREWVFDVLSLHPRSYRVPDPMVSFNPHYEGKFRVVRGGYFASQVEHCRATIRGYETPRWRGAWVGFRLARELQIIPKERDHNPKRAIRSTRLSKSGIR